MFGTHKFREMILPRKVINSLGAARTNNVEGHLNVRFSIPFKENQMFRASAKSKCLARLNCG